MMKRFSFLLFAIPYILGMALSSGCSKTDDAQTDSDSSASSNAFVSSVFDYQYGPGQHIAILSDPASMAGNADHNVLLGGWGGYIIAGFNHDVENGEGADLIVLCKYSVSPEPGVIYVMQDANGNGLPDDKWYEIKGSETDSADCLRNYGVTYYKPANDSANVTWRDVLGNTGVLPNSSKWWWKKTADSVSFCGTRLPDAYFNTLQTSGQQYWAVYQKRFRYGYAENGPAPDRTAGNGYLAKDYDCNLKGNVVEIDSAIDADGRHVKLASIRFVKVQSGTFQQAGWLGEISTEINGIADLRRLMNK